MSKIIDKLLSGVGIATPLEVIAQDVPALRKSIPTEAQRARGKQLTDEWNQNQLVASWLVHPSTSEKAILSLYGIKALSELSGEDRTLAETCVHNHASYAGRMAFEAINAKFVQKHDAIQKQIADLLSEIRGTWRKTLDAERTRYRDEVTALFSRYGVETHADETAPLRAMHAEHHQHCGEIPDHLGAAPSELLPFLG